jgi:hypothetical protein
MGEAVENKNLNEINDLQAAASAAKSLIYKELDPVVRRFGLCHL